MALEALIDAGVRFTGDADGNHFEVHHIMAGRCLMALSTVGRTR